MLQRKHLYSQKLLADDDLKKKEKVVSISFVLPCILYYLVSWFSLRTPSVSALGTEILFKGLCQ